MKVFIAAYGRRYVPLVSVCLESLLRTNDDLEVTVFVDDVPEADLLLLRSGFPEVVFRRRPWIASQSEDFAVRVSSKVDDWCEFVRGCRAGDEVLLLDADTLVRAPVRPLLPDSFDLVYTFKPERWPLNNGVLAVTVSPSTSALLEDLRRRTLEILNDGATRREAAASSGAADQHAMLELLGVDPASDRPVLEAGPVVVRTQEGPVVCTGVPCAVLNQTNSVPVDDEAAILHYKARMRHVIEQDGAFSAARPRSTSDDMVAMWEQEYRALNERALRTLLLESVRTVGVDVRNALISTPRESRGILNSEGLVLIGLLRRLGVTTIVESGRARAQSTFLLGTHLPDVTLHSIEMVQDEDANYGAARVAGLPNVVLHEGGAEDVLPPLLASLKDQTVGLVLDGPKGAAAVRLAAELSTDFPNVTVVAIHDMHRRDTTKRGLPSRGRTEFQYAFDRTIFTDDLDLVGATCDVDADTGHVAWRKGAWELGSYGPTLGIALPTWRDAERVRRQRHFERPAVRIGRFIGSRAPRMAAVGVHAAARATGFIGRLSVASRRR